MATAFQSTRPVRGATHLCPSTLRKPNMFQSTRPVRGATLKPIDQSRVELVSIHAPREGRDPPRRRAGGR